MPHPRTAPAHYHLLRQQRHTNPPPLGRPTPDKDNTSALMHRCTGLACLSQRGSIGALADAEHAQVAAKSPLAHPGTDAVGDLVQQGFPDVMVEAAIQRRCPEESGKSVS